MRKIGQVIDATQPHRKDAPTYSLPASCTNCGWRGTVKLTRGYRAPGGVGSHGAECVFCGCSTVIAQHGVAA